ncbi:MAG: group III truncated hemoglobin [Bacteroidota bacterium]|nr:group III truncated hemoglobin [Bacteroidota bacterium]
MADIASKKDIELLVNTFYSKIKEDELLSDFFGKVVPIDWEHHLPRMVGFWEFILFSTPNAYTGSVMEPHFHVNEIKKFKIEHFERWIYLFKKTVDELFEGPKSNEAKEAAIGIASTMKYKLIGRTAPDFKVTAVDDTQQQ